MAYLKLLHLLVFALIIFGSNACSASAPTPTPDAIATGVAEAQAVAATLTASAPTPTPTFTATNTPTSTFTPLPTHTPTLTPTKAPFQAVKGRIAQASGKGISALAMNPSGTLIAYGDYGDEEVHVLNVETGTEAFTLKGHNTSIGALAFSPDGKLLASAGTVHSSPDEDKVVRIWSLATGEMITYIETTGVNYLNFSPDSKLLAIGGTGEPRQVSLWSVETKSQRLKIPEIFDFVNFSPDGTLFTARKGDNLVYLFDVATGNSVETLSAHNDLVDIAVFSPKGDLIASGSADGSIWLWDAKSYQRKTELRGHETMIDTLTFSPDGKGLASLGSGLVWTRDGSKISISFTTRDKFIRFWDTTSGKQVQQLSMPEGVSYFAFNQDWSRLITANRKGLIQFWGFEP